MFIGNIHHVRRHPAQVLPMGEKVRIRPGFLCFFLYECAACCTDRMSVYKNFLCSPRVRWKGIYCGAMLLCNWFLRCVVFLPQANIADSHCTGEGQAADRYEKTQSHALIIAAHCGDVSQICFVNHCFFVMYRRKHGQGGQKAGYSLHIGSHAQTKHHGEKYSACFCLAQHVQAMCCSFLCFCDENYALKGVCRFTNIIGKFIELRLLINVLLCLCHKLYRVIQP